VRNSWRSFPQPWDPGAPGQPLVFKAASGHWQVSKPLQPFFDIAKAMKKMTASEGQVLEPVRPAASSPQTTALERKLARWAQLRGAGQIAGERFQGPHRPARPWRLSVQRAVEEGKAIGGFFEQAKTPQCPRRQNGCWTWRPGATLQPPWQREARPAASWAQAPAPARAVQTWGLA